MSDHNCGTCNFRAKYNNDPKSFFGKLWRWHANWCPGWKSYMESLPDKERISIAEKYNMNKFM